jgi:hypothetical protein
LSFSKMDGAVVGIVFGEFHQEGKLYRQNS